MKRRQRLRVKRKTNPKALAGAIDSFLREGKEPYIEVIGELALEQAIKGIILARGRTILRNIDLGFRPEIVEKQVLGKGETQEIILLTLEPISESGTARGSSVEKVIIPPSIAEGKIELRLAA